MALALSAPKLMAEILNSDKAYGCRHSAPPHHYAEIVTAGGKWIDRVIDPLEIVAVDVLMSAERTLVERTFGALMCDGPLRAVEGRSVGFAFQEILAYLRSDLLQPEADVGEDRIVPSQAVAGLQKIPEPDPASRWRQMAPHHKK